MTSEIYNQKLQKLKKLLAQIEILELKEPYLVTLRRKVVFLEIRKRLKDLEELEKESLKLSRKRIHSISTYSNINSDFSGNNSKPKKDIQYLGNNPALKELFGKVKK